MIQRIILNAAIVLSLIVLPWWITALLAFVGILVCNWYFEAIIVGFVMDSLYGVPTSFFHGFTCIITISSALVLVLVLYIKPKLR